MEDIRIKELLAPYRREFPCFLAGENQWEDICVRPVRSMHQDSRKIAAMVALTVSHLPKIRQLVGRLNGPHRSQRYKMAESLELLKLLLVQLVKSEEGDSACSILLITVESFQLQINCFRNHVHDRVLKSLQAWTSPDCCAGAGCITAGDINALIVLVEYVNEQFQRFYEELDAALYNVESCLTRQLDRLQLSKQLKGLQRHIECAIMLEDDLQLWLENWKKDITEGEKQQLLN